MQIPWPECSRAPVKILANPTPPGCECQHTNQQHAAGNGCTFEVGNLVPARREALGRHVVSRQSAYSTRDKVNQRNPVPTSAYAGGETDGRRSDAKRDDVRQRIQLASERRMRVPKSCYADFGTITISGDLRTRGQTSGGPDTWIPVVHREQHRVECKAHFTGRDIFTDQPGIGNRLVRLAERVRRSDFLCR